MRIELNSKEIRLLYIIVAGTSLVFILMTSPMISLPVEEGRLPQLYTLFDYIRFHCDLKNEQNIATWYSSIILFSAGIVAALNSHADAATSKLIWVHRLGWALIAFVLIVLSADETATIHENLALILNFINKDDAASQIERGAGDWIPILLPFIIVVAVGMILFFSFVLSKYRRFLLIAVLATCCWVAAIFAESIEAGILRLQMSREVEGFLEEGFEIIGTTGFFIAFLEYFKARQILSDEKLHGKIKTFAKQKKEEKKRRMQSQQ